MRLLLDTHTLLWSLGSPRRLPQPIQRHILAAENVIYFSAASLLELAVKRAAGGRHRPEIESEVVLGRSLEAGYVLLEIGARHAVAVETIAPFHGDPIDRLLLAQAQIEDMRLVTHDEALAAYDPRTILF